MLDRATPLEVAADVGCVGRANDGLHPVAVAIVDEGGANRSRLSPPGGSRHHNQRVGVPAHRARGLVAVGVVAVAVAIRGAGHGMHVGSVVVDIGHPGVACQVAVACRKL